MREWRLENTLKHLKAKLENWAQIIQPSHPDLSIWMEQEIHRIQIQLEWNNPQKEGSD